MVFTSHIFLFYFLPLVIFVYYLLPRGRNFFLLCASYVFYGWWQPWFVFLMMFATWVNYVCGRAITNPGATEKSRKTALVTSVVVSLGTLGFFKYFMFFQNNLNDLLRLLGEDTFTAYVVILPIGISFYIFQSLSYSVDLYRGQSPPVKSFFDFACYVALFPQLIAGPIVRYNTIADQLVKRDHTIEKFSSGAALFILGFAKKILLANPMGEIADPVFAAETPAMLDAWVGVTAYAFQIYFDFSGYSDMAIGLGRMFGFEFLRNFNAPYLADSITDFWRRWHISLSTFLRDYLYIPLGGNQKGARRTYLNLAIVMLLGGLWHGASWVFVIWGAYHGALLGFERWRGKESVYNLLPRPFRIALTFVLVLFSWVLFRSPDFQQAVGFFGSMFGILNPEGGSILLAAELYSFGHLILLGICAVFAFQPLQAFDWVNTITWPKIVGLIVIFLVAIMSMFVQAFNPFLYFQF